MGGLGRKGVLRCGGVYIYNNMAEPRASFFSWKFAHYFSFVEQKERNVYVKCNLCLGTKCLSMAANSNSNLLKHLGTQHAATKQVVYSCYGAANLKNPISELLE